MKNIFENTTTEFAKTLIDAGYFITKEDVIFAAEHDSEMFDFLISINSFKEHADVIVHAAVKGRTLDSIELAVETYETLAGWGNEVIEFVACHVASKGLSNNFNFVNLLHYKYKMDVSSIINAEILHNLNQSYEVIPDHFIKKFYDSADKLVLALALSIKAKNYEFVMMLLKAGADPNMVPALIIEGLLEDKK